MDVMDLQTVFCGFGDWSALAMSSGDSERANHSHDLIDDSDAEILASRCEDRLKPVQGITARHIIEHDAPAVTGTAIEDCDWINCVFAFPKGCNAPF